MCVLPGFFLLLNSILKLPGVFPFAPDGGSTGADFGRTLWHRMTRHSVCAWCALSEGESCFKLFQFDMMADRLWRLDEGPKGFIQIRPCHSFPPLMYFLDRNARDLLVLVQDCFVLFFSRIYRGRNRLRPIGSVRKICGGTIEVGMGFNLKETTTATAMEQTRGGLEHQDLR